MPDQELLLPARRPVHSIAQRWLIAVALFAIAAAALAHGTGRGDSYVLRDGEVTYMLGEGMSAQALKALQARFGREFLWARRHGHAYLIRDRDTLDAALAVVARKSTRTEQARAMRTLVEVAGRNGKATPAE